MKRNRILVTGAGGFIGSHLTEKLIKSGCKVRAFVRYNSKNNWGWLEESKYKKDIEFYSGDVRDFDSVYDAMRGCNTVYHLAALIGIPYSYISPAAYIATNIGGTYNILQGAKLLGVENVLITSTSEVYGSAKYTPIDEEHPISPQSPYAASKASADHIALSYYRSFNLPVKIVRPFNTYGPRQSARAVIPTIITQVLTRNKIRLGSLYPLRDLTYIDDIVSGFIGAAGTSRTVGNVINLGSGSDISVGELVNKILTVAKKKANIIPDDRRVRPRKSEVGRLCADISKTRKLIAWSPRVSLDKGLRNTLHWIEAHLDIYKIDIYNV